MICIAYDRFINFDLLPLNGRSAFPQTHGRLNLRTQQISATGYINCPHYLPNSLWSAVMPGSREAVWPEFSIICTSWLQLEVCHLDKTLSSCIQFFRFEVELKSPPAFRSVSKTCFDLSFKPDPGAKWVKITRQIHELEAYIMINIWDILRNVFHHFYRVYFSPLKMHTLFI